MLKKIKNNSKIGVIAPAFQPNQERLEKGIQYLEKSRYSVVRGNSLTEKHGYLAGSDQTRIDDLHNMFKDPEIDAIICARGGWGCLRLLDKIDFDLIKNNPKLIVGYSDITTLQLAVLKKSRLPSMSGPMVADEMGTGIKEFTEQHFWQQIYNENETYSIEYNFPDTQEWNSGKAEGILLGGCLSMIAHQLGTDYSPDYNNSILFLEDVGEEPYRIDRYLAQLKQAGIFKQINGLILGNFIDCENQDPDRQSFTIDEVLKDYFSYVPYPVIYNFPYGHDMIKFSMPIGVQTRISTGDQVIKFANPFIV